MKKVLMIVGAALAALVLLLVVAAVAVAVFVDPNDYREQIGAAVERQTGRELVIEGDLSLSFFPWLGLETGRLILGNAAGFGPEPFAQVERAVVRVRLLPLLRGQVQVGTLVLHGVEAHLARRADGTTNWDDLVQTQPEEPEERPEDPRALAGLAIGGVDLRGGRVVWDDALEGVRYELSELRLATDEVVMGRPMRVSAAGRAQASEPALDARFALEGRVTAEPDRGRYAAQGLTLDVDARGAALPGGTFAGRVVTDVEVDVERQTLELARLEVEAAGMALSAQARGEAIVDAPRLRGSASVRIDDGARLLRAAGLHENPPVVPQGLAGARLELGFEADLGAQTLNVPQLTLRGGGVEATVALAGENIVNGARLRGQLRGAVTDGQRLLALLPPEARGDLDAAALRGAGVEAEFNADLEAQTAAVPKLVVQGLGVRAQAAAKATRLLQQPNIEGTLEVAEFAPRRVLQQLRVDLPDMQDPNTLARAALRLGFAASAEHVAVSDLVLSFDDTTLRGEASVRDFERPVVRFRFDADRIDADRYLPPETEQTAPTPTGAAAAGAGELPLELLRALDVQGRVSLGEVKVMDLRASQLQATLAGRGGQLRLHPVSARLYSGQYRGDMALDVRGEQPRFSMNDSLQGVQVGALLQDMMGDDLVRGTANLELKLGGEGLEPDAILRTLSGEARVLVRDGAIKNLNIAGAIRQGYARFQGQQLSAAEQERSTDFAELRASAQITAGLVSSQDLQLNSPLLRVRGSGTLDLNTEQVDYVLNTIVVATLEGQDAKEAQAVRGLSIPIRVAGSYTDPKLSLELRPLLEARAREEADKLRREAEQRARQELQKREQQIEQELKQREQELKQKLEEGTRDRLRDLLRR